MQKIIAPSFLAADLNNIPKELKTVSSAKFIHVDIMDNKFVPNTALSVENCAQIAQNTDQVVDVHLMVTDPHNYIEAYANAGADYITFHVESETNIQETIDLIKSFDVYPGLVVKPATSVDTILPYIDQLGMVLVMTVEPGFGGQSFMEDQMEKVTTLRKYINEHNLDTHIQVDGGISEDTIGIAAKAGANVFVAGSAVFKVEEDKRNDYIEKLAK